MTEAPVKRGRGRPRKHPLPEAAPQPSFNKPAASPDVGAGPLSDDDFFEQHYAKPASGKRMNILSADEETLTKLFRLGKLFCTQKEAAAFLGVAPRTLQNFLYANEAAMNAWSDGLENAKISLRRKQLALADKNAPMGIFLGKNYLGQRDENHNINTNINKPANELDEAALEEIAKRGLVQTDAAPTPEKSKLN